MIDTHCHLSYSDYDNLDEIINEMKDNDIKCIINGCDVLSNEEAISLKEKYDNVYASIGYQPEYVLELPNNYIELLEKNIKNVVAIGEIGLDYHYTKDNTERQKEVFEQQLILAEKYNLPVIVHTRDSINDTYEILKKHKVKGTIHAFNGSYEMAIKFINLGFKLGIGGVITFKNCNLKDVINKISVNDIVLETDSPYLSPEPVRGAKNNPNNLKYIVDFVANIKGVTPSEIVNITSKTATTLFDLN